jgi:hypothetical protein
VILAVCSTATGGRCSEMRPGNTAHGTILIPVID